MITTYQQILLDFGLNADDAEGQSWCVFFFSPLQTDSYMYYGTDLDNKDHLNYETVQKTDELVVAAAQLAGQMALRLVHDLILDLDTSRYSSLLTNAVSGVYTHIQQLSRVCVCVFVSRRNVGRHVNICTLSSAVRPVKGSESELVGPSQRQFH